MNLIGATDAAPIVEVQIAFWGLKTGACLDDKGVREVEAQSGLLRGR